MDGGIHPNLFFKWQIWMLTTHWNHLGFLISIPGVRNVLQSQEGFLIFLKIFFFDFSMFLDVLGDLWTFFFENIFWEQHFVKVIGKISKIFDISEKFRFFFFTFFNVSGCFWGSENFFFWGGGEAPYGGRRPPQEQEARRASMFLYIYIYIYTYSKIYIYI